MRKKNPNIIRVGDIVNIVNPRIFIRCGYNLTKDDLRPEIDEKYGKQIHAFIKSIPILKSRSYDSVRDVIVYDYMVHKRFGGNERKIFTEIKEISKDKKYRVVSIKFVKTGIYVPGSTSWTGEYEDFFPPYLSYEQTHKILSIKIVERGFYSWNNYYFEIEANNVRKENKDE